MYVMKNKKQRFIYPQGMTEEEKLLFRMEQKLAKWRNEEYNKRKKELLSKPQNVIKYPKFISGPVNRAKNWYGF